MHQYSTCCKGTLLVAMGLFLLTCSADQTDPRATPPGPTNDFLVDPLATPQTVALFQNLISVTADNFCFGHQETTAYGVGWVFDGEGLRSDIKDVCGDYPAVYGWDIGDIGETTNVDGVAFSTIKTLIVDAYSRGGINTISMHLDNPVTGHDAWDRSKAVEHILPGGTHHDQFLSTLDRVASFMKELRSAEDVFIPIIFRPFHEHNQAWPWWGTEACTETEFISLWKMTIDHLINQHNLHHLLYAISPQDIKTEEQYFIRYPGDDYVDILGMDSWRRSYSNDNISFLGEALDMLSKAAQSRGKISALTEVGLDQLTISDWWTEHLLKALRYTEYSDQIAWLLVWRNADVNHFHAPYPGQISANDFRKFYQDSATLFERDLPNMYRSE